MTDAERLAAIIADEASRGTPDSSRAFLLRLLTEGGMGASAATIAEQIIWWREELAAGRETSEHAHMEHAILASLERLEALRDALAALRRRQDGGAGTSMTGAFMRTFGDAIVVVVLLALLGLASLVMYYGSGVWRVIGVAGLLWIVVAVRWRIA